MNLVKTNNHEIINRTTKTAPYEGAQVPGGVDSYRHRDGHGADLVQCDAHDHYREPFADPRRYRHHHPVENHRVV